MKTKYSSLFSLPYLIWSLIFIIVPMGLVVVFAFTTEGGQFTLDYVSQVGEYTNVLVRSVWLAAIATIICLLIGYPLAFIMSRMPGFQQRTMLMLIMLPMWMNFLLRTYSWMSLLEDNGIINQFLGAIHAFDLINGVNGLLNSSFGLSLSTDIEYFHMINTQGAIVVGMVCNFLPFMIMPIFSVIDKIDHRVIEAAQDLGADNAMVFRKIIFPLSLPGVLSGVTMVFIPSVSTFALSRLLGGGKTLLLGDLIEMQFLGNTYNPHLGSAIALVMMIIVLVCMAVMNRFGEGEEGVAIL